MEKIINNLKICPRWDNCSANVCPIDSDATLKYKLPEEESCPFTIKKRGNSQKGIKTLAPAGILGVISELNVKMLHRRNQKRWRDAGSFVTRRT